MVCIYSIFILGINQCLWASFFHFKCSQGYYTTHISWHSLFSWNRWKECQKKLQPNPSKIQWENLWKERVTLIYMISKLIWLTYTLFFKRFMPSHTHTYLPAPVCHVPSDLAGSTCATQGTRDNGCQGLTTSLWCVATNQFCTQNIAYFSL